jgi:hypothetical protein
MSKQLVGGIRLNIWVCLNDMQSSEEFFQILKVKRHSVKGSRTGR